MKLKSTLGHPIPPFAGSDARTKGPGWRKLLAPFFEVCLEDAYSSN